MNTGVIIQARLGSTRFPNKIIKDFHNGQSVLDIIIKNILSTVPSNFIVLATTTNPDDDELSMYKEKYDIHLFRGNEHNVLDRFIRAAEAFNYENLIRICSDNPFLDIGCFEQILNTMSENNYDYCSHRFSDNRPAIKTHFGMFAEGVSLKALKRVQELTNDRLYLEHVTNYIYTHPDLFDIFFINAPDIIYERNDIRLTLDTKDDFDLLKNIYNRLNCQTEVVTIEQIVSLLDKDKDYLYQMKKQIEQNEK